METGTQTLAKVTTYEALRDEVRRTLETGRARAREAVEQEKTRTYWEAGGLIDRHVLDHGERGGYGDKVIRRLAADLQTNQTLLYYARQFARAYPIFPASGKLTWSHYKALLPLENEDERRKLEEKVEEWGWSSRQLTAEVSKAGGTAVVAEASVKSVRRASAVLKPLSGKTGLYRVFQKRPEDTLWWLDLGFSCYVELPKLKRPFLDGDFVAAAAGTRELKEGVLKLDRQATARDLYLYEAQVERVVDGDTVWMQVSLGFGLWTRQKLRLRGIDAPELATARGQSARQFVKDALARARQVRVRTTKPDKYDRYLADLFIDGLFLNGELLKQGFASLA